MVHVDLALTEKYVVVFDFPLTVRPARIILEDKFPVEYEPKNGARIGLVPRLQGGVEGGKTKWFEVDAGVVLHAAHAVERDDGTVVVHAFRSVPNGSSSYILDYSPSFLHEWVLNPDTGVTLSDRCINPNVCVEFPAVCEASTPATAAGIGGPNLHFKVPRTAVLLDSVIKLALVDDAGRSAGEEVGRYDLEFGWHFVSEPTLVTKTGGVGSCVLLIATFVPPSTTNDSMIKSRLLILYGLHSAFLDWSLLA